MRTKFAFLSALFLLLVGQVVFAQVTGTVQDGDNFPVADAEVTVRGGDASATTDESGQFSIDAKVGDVLVVVDAMGISQDFSVTKNNMGILSFGSAVELTGIEIRSVFDPSNKIQAGVSSISGEKLENLNPTTSVDEMLGGKVSGLFSVAQNGSPGSVANVIVRGALGLTGGFATPLYVVDGTYMAEDDVNSINPNDIESINVLKEAAQTAVYGARGANGVVIIKTKTAKKGSASMQYNTRFGFGERVDYSNTNLMNARQLLEYENGLAQVTNPDGSSAGLGIARTAEEIDRLAAFDHDWADDLFKTSYLTSHYFSAQLGGDKSTTNFSLGYDSDNGIVNFYKGFQRITASLGSRSELRDWLRAGYNISGAYQVKDDPRDRRNSQSPFVGVLQYKPYAPLYQTDADGNILYNELGDPIYNQTGLATLSYQSLDEMRYTKRSRKNFRLFGSAFLEADLFKNVRARSSFGATYDRYKVESFLMPIAYLNQVLTVNPNGTKTDLNSDRLDYNWRNEITYENNFGKHYFSATAASEYSRDNFYAIRLYSEDYPNNFQDVQSLGTVIPGFDQSYTQRWQVTRFGYLGYLSYNYDKKYFLDGYFRRDGSSLTGFENRYGNFWGASLGWDIAKESFVDQSWLNNLMLRASYGEVGDDNMLDRYSNFSIVTQSSGAYNGQFISYPDLTVKNDDATWMTVQKMNLGLEFSLLSHRLRGKFDYFQDNRKDFLFYEQLSSEAGGFGNFINAGEFVTKGYEIELSYDLFAAKNPFQLGVYANFTNLDYEVTELSGDQEEYLIGIFTGSVYMSHTEGMAPYSYKMVRSAGVDSSNGDQLYYTADGQITNVYNFERDAVILDKSPLPTIYGGFGLNASYKGFDLNAEFTYTMGNHIFNLTYSWLTDPSSNDNRVVEAANYWQNPGDTNVLPRPTTNGYQLTDDFLEKGDYLRFRSLSLGYSFDKKLFEGLPITGLRIYTQLQNLAIWTKFRGNPIVGDGSTEDYAVGSENYMSGSYSAFSYPQIRSYNFGINVNF